MSSVELESVEKIRKELQEWVEKGKKLMAEAESLIRKKESPAVEYAPLGKLWIREWHPTGWREATKEEVEEIRKEFKRSFDWVDETLEEMRKSFKRMREIFEEFF